MRLYFRSNRKFYWNGLWVSKYSDICYSSTCPNTIIFYSLDFWKEKEENLNKKVRKEETDFFNKIYPILYELLIERGGLVLIDQRNAVLWDNSVDLTDDAIAVINRVLGSGDETN